MNPRTFLPAIAIAAALLFGTQLARAQGVSITYQGQLSSSGNLTDGNYDLTFSLFNASTSGSQVGLTLTNLDVGVTNGLFTTTLNFTTNAFTGVPLWLALGVRSNDTAVAFTPLNPRQAITPAPYAITASNLSGTLPAAQLPASVVTNGSSSINLTGTFTGNGAGLTSLSATNLSGSLSAAQLGTNVALLNTNQTFSGTNIFSGSNFFTGAVVLTNLTNIFAGNGGGLTNVPSPTQTNYLYVYDTSGQSLATVDTFQQITFNTEAAVSGWVYTAGGSMVAEQAGVYQVQYTVEAYNPSSSSAIDFEVRAVNLTTSTIIPGSQTLVTLPPAGYYIEALSQSFITLLPAGQTIALQFTAGGAASVEGGNVFGDTFPGASMTIVRIQ